MSGSLLLQFLPSAVSFHERASYRGWDLRRLYSSFGPAQLQGCWPLLLVLLGCVVVDVALVLLGCVVADVPLCCLNLVSAIVAGVWDL